MQDGQGRKIEYLRVSVTDRCNLRCQYCMPQEGIEQFAHADCLTLEEIYRIVGVMADMGLKKVRFTGGEPMVRKNLVKLVRDVAELPQIENVAMTTNGVLFVDHVEEFVQAGLTSVNISLDTMDTDKYAQITGRNELDKVLLAIEKSVESGLKVKINCVPARELNATADGRRGASYLQVAELARKYPVDVRFIELMPIGCGKNFTRIAGDETLRALSGRYGSTEEIVEAGHRGDAGYGSAKEIVEAGHRGDAGYGSAKEAVEAGHRGDIDHVGWERKGRRADKTGCEEKGGGTDNTGREKLQKLQEAMREGQVNRKDSCVEGPAKYVRFPGFQGRIGFIDPMSHQFCSECNRVRLTVDGELKLCLYYADGLALKRLLRNGASDQQVQDAILEALQRKPKEHRFGQSDRKSNERTWKMHTPNEGEADARSMGPEERRMVQIGG